MSFGAYIRSLRVDAGLSQEALCALVVVAGINQGRLSAIELNKGRSPSAKQLEAILKAVGATDAQRARALRLSGSRSMVPA